MSAIICGYEVPKKFSGKGWTDWHFICDLVIHDYNYCRKDVQNYLEIKNAKYVLKELPNQHGRLIDADAHIQSLRENQCGERCRKNHDCINCGIDMYIRIVENEPTILEAEG